MNLFFFISFLLINSFYGVFGVQRATIVPYGDLASVPPDQATGGTHILLSPSFGMNTAGGFVKWQSIIRWPELMKVGLREGDTIEAVSFKVGHSPYRNGQGVARLNEVRVSYKWMPDDILTHYLAMVQVPKPSTTFMQNALYTMYDYSIGSEMLADGGYWRARFDIPTSAFERGLHLLVELSHFNDPSDNLCGIHPWCGFAVRLNLQNQWSSVFATAWDATCRCGPYPFIDTCYDCGNSNGARIGANQTPYVADVLLHIQCKDEAEHCGDGTRTTTTSATTEATTTAEATSAAATTTTAPTSTTAFQNSSTTAPSTTEPSTDTSTSSDGSTTDAAGTTPMVSTQTPTNTTTAIVTTAPDALVHCTEWSILENGDACMVCESGYYRVNYECVDCPPRAGALAAALFIGLCVGALLIWRLLSTSVWPYILAGIQYVQMLSILVQFSLVPSSVRLVLAAGSVTNFYVFNLKCLLDSSEFYTWVVEILIFPAVLLLAVLVRALLAVTLKWRAKVGTRVMADRGILLVAFLSYIPLYYRSLEAFRTVDVFESADAAMRTVLFYVPVVEAWSSEHAVMIGLASFFIVCNTLALPLVLAFGLRRARDQSFSHDGGQRWPARLSFLTRAYSSTSLLWPLVDMAFNVVQLSVVMLITTQVDALLGFLVIRAVWILLFFIRRPYQKIRLNWTVALLNVTFIGVLISLLVARSNADVGAIVALICLALGLFIIVVNLVFDGFRGAFHALSPHHKDRNGLQRQSLLDSFDDAPRNRGNALFMQMNLNDE